MKRSIELVPVEKLIIGDLKIPSRYPRRKWWHPIEDRHWHRTKIDKSLVGKEVLVSKFIIRCGYFFQPTDVDYHDIREIVAKHFLIDLSRSFGRTSAETRKMFGIDESGSEDVWFVEKMEDALGYGVYKSPLYQARMDWVRECNKLPEYKPWHRLRTFWYIDIKDVDPDEKKWLKVEGIKAHQVGVQYPASGGYDSYGGGYEYDPGGISPGNYQQTYKTYVFVRNYDDYWEGFAEIHPLDVLDVRERTQDE